MRPPSPMPLAARQAAWDSVWRILLAPKPPDPPPAPLDKGTAAGGEPAAKEGR